MKLRAVIMKSAAGWYVGVRRNGMPYTRCTGYFLTEEQAQFVFDSQRSFTCYITGDVFYK